MVTAEEAFFRQRKNLIASSLLVSFINIAGGQLKKINLLGNEIVFSNPQIIPLSLGVALAYFFIRYIQYAHDIDDKGFRQRFYGRVAQYLEPYLLSREFGKENSRLRTSYPDKQQIEVRQFIIFNDAVPTNTAFMSFVGKKGGIVIDETIEVRRKELAVPFARAAFYVVFRTRLVTDYVLPLILAIAAFSSYSNELRGAFTVWLQQFH